MGRSQCFTVLHTKLKETGAKLVSYAGASVQLVVVGVLRVNRRRRRREKRLLFFAAQRVPMCFILSFLHLSSDTPAINFLNTPTYLPVYKYIYIVPTQGD